MLRRTPLWACNAILSISRGGSICRLSSLSIFLLYGAVQALALYLCARHDSTLTLPGNGRGLSTHYGVWSIVVTDPLIIISVGIAHAIFRRAIAEIRFNSEDGKRIFFKNIVPTYTRFLYARTYSIWIYYLFVFIGIIAVANNIYQTISPLGFYGNDVFDDFSYKFGFLANKVNIIISWVIIYPAAGFLLITMCFETRLLLDNARNLGGLKGDLFHPDQCFGFAKLAWLNISLLVPFGFAFVVMFSLSLTHTKLYQSLVLPFVVLSFVFFIASFLIIRPVVKEASKSYADAYNSILGAIDKKGWSWDRVNYNIGLTRICLASTRPSPYADFAANVLIMIRLVPAILAVTRLLLPTSV